MKNTYLPLMVLLALLTDIKLHETAEAQPWTSRALNAKGFLLNPDCSLRLSTDDFGEKREKIHFTSSRISEYSLFRTKKQVISFPIDNYDISFPDRDILIDAAAQSTYWKDFVNQDIPRVNGMVVLSLSSESEPTIGFQYVTEAGQTQQVKYLGFKPGKFTLEENCPKEERSIPTAVVPTDFDLTNIETNRRLTSILDNDPETRMQFGKPTTFVLDLGAELAVHTLKLTFGRDSKSNEGPTIETAISSDGSAFSVVPDTSLNKLGFRNALRQLKINQAARYLRVKISPPKGQIAYLRDVSVSVLEPL